MMVRGDDQHGAITDITSPWDGHCNFVRQYSMTWFLKELITGTEGELMQGQF